MQSCGIVAPVALLLLGIVGILLLVIPTLDMKEQPEFSYGIVLDAGSSHTAMYVYKWPSDKQNGTGIVTQHSECHVDGGGISSYAGTPDGAGASLETCMKQAVRDIPKYRHHLTPIYLGATAGMRLLNMTSPSESDKILQYVKDKIRSYPFSFRGAAILTGQEEGTYGWVTVNYLLENFIKYDFVGRWLSPGKKTVGALDFGGASTQISFVTEDAVEDKKNKMILRLYSRNYTLYTQSFLCYGRDQMLRRLLAFLMKVLVPSSLPSSPMQSQEYRSSIFHPCYPAGHNVSITLDKVFESPCTLKEKPNPYNPHAAVIVMGTGHYQHCLGNVSSIFSFSSCSFSKCSFDGVFQPKATGSFMAFSAFYYTHYFLQRTTGITAASPSLLEGASRAVCNMTFDEMLKKAPDQEKRLQDYCTASVFLQVLMVRGYGFDEFSFPQVSFQRKVGDTSIGWALGYMLSLSSLLPGESVALRKALRPEAWVCLLFIFALLLLIMVMYLLSQTCRRKKGSSNVI
ncbi:ectonucleoside triphosphate diphosphohydrolase 2 isoform X1 [Scleropages formosus]|uniref:ectonucleoside triphosphate diphosphohydrolase 2 isoform X1 n=1 Tax=Scleropages formosus TaxID=113540 RepID=UPI0010FAA01C|nr:ectonucleoside triphosphate diphosphohydrolase 2 isoform X1 [Scleropages formosus]